MHRIKTTLKSCTLFLKLKDVDTNVSRPAGGWPQQPIFIFPTYFAGGYSDQETTPLSEVARKLRDAHAYCNGGNLDWLEYIWTLCDYNVRLTRKELAFRNERQLTAYPGHV